MSGEGGPAERFATPAATLAGERVRDRLAEKKIVLTGASGFLGKAVMATLLRSGGEIGQLVVLLRAPSATAARQRLLDDVLAGDGFTGVPIGEIHEKLDAGRILALPCDLEADDLGDPGEGAWAGVDVAIHCAATVSFEEALDDALNLNAFGPTRLLERLRGAGSEPHFVHVSTAYVADRNAGEILEEDTHHGLAGLDPEAMLAEARQWRGAAEDESSAAELSRRFAKAAARDAAQRSGMDAAERAEELRRRWVQERLSRRGRRRAIELGWADTYALSKAIGERMLTARSTRTTVIRPTIIESALQLPAPGWLEGIKVADPLILAYASRGLTHLPGRASNVIDIVPVDHVANACVVAAAHPPETALRMLALASSARNPISIGELAAQIRRYFLREPLRGRNGSPIEIGELKFVDRSVALRRTVRRERLARGAAKLAMASPVDLPQERMLRSTRALAERVTRMVEIYGAYTELNCVFDDANTVRLAAALHPADREELPFDTAAIEWDEYLQEIHLPQVHRLAEAG